MDRATKRLAPDQIADRQRIKRAYIAAVRDWVLKGAASVHAYQGASARTKISLPDDDIALAHAHFRLARYLMRHGKSGAESHFAEASRLHPSSWNIWRQAAKKDATGLASGPEFWARVDALGDRPYYRPIDTAGLDGSN